MVAEELAQCDFASNTFCHAVDMVLPQQIFANGDTKVHLWLYMLQMFTIQENCRRGWVWSQEKSS